MNADFADHVRLIVASYARQNLASRAEVEELRRALYASARLSPDDVHRMGLLLRALVALAPGQWVSTGELVRAASHATGEAGEQLREALAPFAGRRRPARALGALLRRATGIPIDGLHLRRLDPPHPRDDALYCVAGSGL